MFFILYFAIGLLLFWRFPLALLGLTIVGIFLAPVFSALDKTISSSIWKPAMTRTEWLIYLFVVVAMALWMLGT